MEFKAAVRFRMQSPVVIHLDLQERDLTKGSPESPLQGSYIRPFADALRTLRRKFVNRCMCVHVTNWIQWHMEMFFKT